MEVHIATAADLHEGRTLASRLRAEGIPCRLRSESLGPFVVTVGSMATVDVFVPQEFAELAEQVLSMDSGSGGDATSEAGTQI